MPSHPRKPSSAPYVTTLKLRPHDVLHRTKLIDDAKRPVPQYRGLIHGTTEIVKAEGLRGIYRGLFPVVRSVRTVSGQSAHQAVSDDAARRQLRGSVHYILYPQAILPRSHQRWSGTAHSGYLWNRRHCWSSHRLHYHASRVSEHYLTRVFRSPTFHSVIKTRMQSLEARSQYRNSFHCAYRIFTEEGVLRFWTGTTPRLVRLVVSNFEGCMRRTPEITPCSSREGLSLPCTKRLSPSSAVDLSGRSPLHDATSYFLVY